MALVLNDRVRETTSVVGTGTVTLLGYVDGYQAFSVIGDGNTCYYTISDQVGFNWEVGIGTYTSSGNTLARTTVLASSNGGALVLFTAGTKDVFVTYPAEKAVYINETGTTSNITKAMVGLGNADNTSDADKPISTATQSGLDLKAPSANPTFTGVVKIDYGTIALPAIAFSSATNTGIWGSGSGTTATVGISCNGKSTVTIRNTTSTINANTLDILASTGDASLKVSGTGTGHLTLNAKASTGYVRIGNSSVGVLINTTTGPTGIDNFIVGSTFGSGSNNISMGGIVTSNTCYGDGNILIGDGNSSASDGNTLIGINNYSSYSYCTSIGINTMPFHDYSISFSNAGSTQRSLYCLSTTTVGVVTSQLFIDGSQPAVPNIISVIALKGQILVYNGVAGYALFDIVVMANTTAVLGFTVTLVYATGTLSTLLSTNITASVTASVTGAALSINILGLAGLTLTWQATLDSTGG